MRRKLSCPDIIDLCSDEEETEEVDFKDAKPIHPLDHHYTGKKPICFIVSDKTNFNASMVKQEPEECRSSNSSSSITDRGSSPTNGASLASTSACSAVPLCRQFWRSGDYELGQDIVPLSINGRNRLRIHPKFLHSNATSHKWAFGAIAELLDNAVDEVQNGATYVNIDKFTNPLNGNPALLIQDDGGGMDSESLRRCMSFGFSEKQSGSSIGQYGNGFKTSTMRIGADVIVFTRCTRKRILTQSVGLLSYTFLTQTGCDDIIVPTVDYEFGPLTDSCKKLYHYGEKQFSSNLSVILKWSPFSTEAELLKQFDELGHHGTRIIIFNLWLNDDGNMELDFESNAKDILITGAHKNAQKATLEYKYVANQLNYSLRAYTSILYLCIPKNFRIILREQVVEPHQIANDLIYRECILYKPQVGGKTEAAIVTTVGFLEGAPNVNVHGFNVYHMNRLILPFWKVANNSYGKGRGVVGILEANFIKPTHDKQDFEKSTLYQKLENRLKEMTYEYWDLHSHLVGYNNKKNPRAASALQMAQLGTTNLIQQVNVNSPATSKLLPSHNISSGSKVLPVSHTLSNLTPGELTKYSDNSKSRLHEKRKHESQDTVQTSKLRALPITAEHISNHDTVHEYDTGKNRVFDIKTMIHENKKLHQQCLECEEVEKQLVLKTQKLRREHQSFEKLYNKLLMELKAMDAVKTEKQ